MIKENKQALKSLYFENQQLEFVKAMIDNGSYKYISVDPFCQTSIMLEFIKTMTDNGSYKSISVDPFCQTSIIKVVDGHIYQTNNAKHSKYYFIHSVDLGRSYSDENKSVPIILEISSNLFFSPKNCGFYLNSYIASTDTYFKCLVRNGVSLESAIAMFGEHIYTLALGIEPLITKSNCRIFDTANGEYSTIDGNIDFKFGFYCQERVSISKIDNTIISTLDNDLKRKTDEEFLSERVTYFDGDNITHQNYTQHEERCHIKKISNQCY